MPIELVEIVNPNGRKGLVAATSAAATAYRQPPSARVDIVETPDGPPTDEWTNAQITSYATAHGIDLSGLGARPTKAELLAAVANPPAPPVDPALSLGAQSSTPTTNESQED